jgi:hypothetical protein
MQDEKKTKQPYNQKKYALPVLHWSTFLFIKFCSTAIRTKGKEALSTLTVKVKVIDIAPLTDHDMCAWNKIPIDQKKHYAVQIYHFTKHH